MPSIQNCYPGGDRTKLNQGVAAAQPAMGSPPGCCIQMGSGPFLYTKREGWQCQPSFFGARDGTRLRFPRWGKLWCCSVEPSQPACHRQTGLYCSSPILYTKKESWHCQLSFFGARDGTRTHTAVATRTSNVLVYHSNTLASVLTHYSPRGQFCQ